jgi:hypothetical protein
MANAKDGHVANNQQAQGKYQVRGQNGSAAEWSLSRDGQVDTKVAGS